jgi:hypothetical protein
MMRQHHLMRPVGFLRTGQRKFNAILDLVAASPGPGYSGDGILTKQPGIAPVLPFIMMRMDKSKPDLIDVSDAVKGVFAQFGIRAISADERRRSIGASGWCARGAAAGKSTSW